MISIKNLSISIKNKPLINQLNVELKKGEFWAIIGNNGKGKTTLLQTMAGFNPGYDGNILVNGKELSSLKILNRAQSIAFLAQMPEAALNSTVEQSIAYGRYPWHKHKLDKKNEDQIIDKVIESMQLNEIRKKSIQKISGGELRKVEVATILAQNSEIMMLDEPLNHLDVSFRYKLMQLLKQQSQKKTVIIVTHDIQYVQQYCTNVMLLLDNDHIITGSVNQVMTKLNLDKMLGKPLPIRFLNNIYE
jgi:iron complex transport system ATP-binding protein